MSYMLLTQLKLKLGIHSSNRHNVCSVSKLVSKRCYWTVCVWESFTLELPLLFWYCWLDIRNGIQLQKNTKENYCSHKFLRNLWRPLAKSGK